MAFVADLTVALSLCATVVYVPRITSQERTLLRQLADTAAIAQQLDATLRRNIELSAHAGAPLPTVIARQVRAALGASTPHNHRGIVLMTYTPMACERSVHDGLASLRDNHELAELGVPVTVVVGERGQNDREYAMQLREAGYLVFPTAFVPFDSVSNAFFPVADSTFADEPIYFRVDERLRVVSAFHAEQHRPALLDAWLAALR